MFAAGTSGLTIASATSAFEMLKPMALPVSTISSSGVAVPLSLSCAPTPANASSPFKLTVMIAASVNVPTRLSSYTVLLPWTIVNFAFPTTRPKISTDTLPRIAVSMPWLKSCTPSSSTSPLKSGSTVALAPAQLIFGASFG